MSRIKGSHISEVTKEKLRKYWTEYWATHPHYVYSEEERKRQSERMKNTKWSQERTEKQKESAHKRKERNIANKMRTFWDNVDKTESCWKWTGKGTHDDRGRVYIIFNGKREAVYRIAYILTYGIIPDDMCVCHKCDHPFCVNPEHFFLGTQIDNINDCINKGRHKFDVKSGQDNINTKLTVLDVRDIKNQLCNYKRGMLKELAKKYNVVPTTIASIRDNLTWRSI
jgi:hypothetical protein